MHFHCLTEYLFLNSYSLDFLTGLVLLKYELVGCLWYMYIIQYVYGLKLERTSGAHHRRRLIACRSSSPFLAVLVPFHDCRSY